MVDLGQKKLDKRPAFFMRFSWQNRLIFIKTPNVA
jgi:hypothetical protein